MPDGREVPDAASLRARAVEMVRDSARSAGAAWFRFGLVRGAVLPLDWIVRGLDPLFVARRLAEEIEWPHADPRAPDPRWDRRFVSARRVLGDRSALAGTRLHERCHRPLGVHDFVRMIVTHEGRLLGWIGAVRAGGEPPFAAADLRRVAALAPQVADLLIEAEAKERSCAIDGGCELVLGASGSVELASPEACRWLARRGAEAALREWLAAPRHERPPVALGQLVTASTLGDRAGGPPRHLVRLTSIPSLSLHPTYVLSAMQREVAVLAASGATVEDIARLTEVSHTTVRTHLRLAYERLSVTCRAELARALEDAPRPRAVA